MQNCLKCQKELSGRQVYYCSNNCKLTHKEGIQKRTFKKEKQDSSFIAICKLDGKELKEIN